MESTFDMGGGLTPPLDADQFQQSVVKQYAEDCENPSVDACIGAAVDDVWPAPEYRKHQREAVVEILHNLYVEDNDVVTLSAPTGAGKSLILHAVMQVLDTVSNRDSFFTTPLNALIDQVDDDEFIADEIITLKGKNNYSCVHREDRGASVDNAICQRVDSFECQHKEVHHERGGCPYYGRRNAAMSHPEVVTNLSYLMANSMIPETVDSKFDSRELLVIDECQSIEDFALQFVSVTVSDHAVPVVWDQIERPPDTENVEQLAEWLETEVLPPVEEHLDTLERLPELTEEQSDDQESLQQFARKCGNLIGDVRNNHWVANVEGRSLSRESQGDSEVANREVEDDDWSVEFKPIFIGRFLESFLWSQCQKVVLSSATIPKGGFLEEIGLEGGDVGRVEVPSTFPPERRPVYTDCAVGKMTMRERDRTIPKMANRIAEIARHHSDGTPHRGFVHCHSYKIMSRIYKQLPRDVRKRTRCQDPDNREASLEDWLDAPVDQEGLRGGYNEYQNGGQDTGGQVFLSVAQDEGISLDDWRARWQVIAKCAYPYLGPEAKRANYRMDELDDWTWYSSTAVVNLQQAVGRGMRSRDDWCHTYILDQSAVGLIEKNEWQFEDWWLDAVDVDPSDEIPDRA